jgi:serine/threonine-protein kinase
METDLERNPFSGFGYGENARLHLAWKGDVETARRIVADGYAVRAQNPMLEWTAVHTEILGREYDRALALIDDSREPALGELQFFYYPPDLLRGRVLAFVGDDDGSRAAYESAARVLESERQALPDDERIAGALGLAYAGLGLRDEALAEARRAVDLMPLEREFWRGTHRQEELARVYARLGETEDAIDMLETLLSQPGELSAALLRLDPEWDSLRDDPRFQALVEE